MRAYMRLYGLRIGVAGGAMAVAAISLLPGGLLLPGSDVLQGDSATTTATVTDPVAPTLSSVSAFPTSLSAGTTNSIRLSAIATDNNGAATITSVVADLTALGGGRVAMTKGVQVGNGYDYGLSGVTVTTGNAAATLTIPVIVTDNTGRTAQSNATITVTGVSTVPANAPSVNSVTVFPTSITAGSATETVKISLVAQDADGADTINSVVADLTSIGGDRVAMTKGAQVGSGYSYSITGIKLPASITEGAKSIVITATDKTGSSGTGTATITVVKAASTGTGGTGKPVVTSPAVFPATIVANDKDKLKVSAIASDPDGADDVVSMVADLGAIGGGTVAMKKGEQAAAGYIYNLDNITVPASATAGEKTITLIASDKAGNTGMATLKVTVQRNNSNIRIVTQNTGITPLRVSNDGKGKVKINALIELNVNSPGKVGSVTADLTELRLSPIALKPLSDDGAVGDGIGAGDVVLGQTWYVSDDITVPSGISEGTKNVTIRARDTQGNISSHTAAVLVVAPSDLDSAPRVEPTSLYLNPSSAVNDGRTPLQLQVLVTDPDGANDITGASADLRAIGGSPNAAMTPDRTEGNGKWFTIDTTVPSSVAASADAYAVKITAVDSTGAINEILVSVPVTDAGTLLSTAQANTPPKLVFAQAVSATEVEVVWDRPMKVEDINRSGAGFSIGLAENADQKLSISSARVSATGQVVTLRTATQRPGQSYVLGIVAENIRSASGRAAVPGLQNTLTWSGWRGYTDDKPRITRIDILDNYVVQVTLNTSLLMGSINFLRPGDHASVQVNGKNVAVRALDFADSSTLLINTADELPASGTVSITINGVQTVSGIRPGSGITAQVRLASGQSGATSVPTADINNDGKIDFADFTLFSSQYRQGNKATVQLDFTGDGAVDFADFTAFLAAYRAAQ